MNEYKTRVKKIKTMLDKGYTQIQIAQELNRSPTSIGKFIAKARDNKDLPPKKLKTTARKIMPLGSLGKTIDKQSPEFQNWVAKQTKELTVAEVAVAIMLDTFYEETEQ